MRQWVLSLPERLRPALHNHAALATRVLRIVIGSVQRKLRRSVAAPAGPRPGAVSFLQRISSALNEHWHHHCCVSDGVFVAADDQSRAFVSGQGMRLPQRSRRRHRNRWRQARYQQRDDLWTRRSHRPDPPLDVMPEYENHNPEMVW